MKKAGAGHARPCALPDPGRLQADRDRHRHACVPGSGATARSRRPVTIGAGCTRKPTSRACASSTAPSDRDTASGGSAGLSDDGNCATLRRRPAPPPRPRPFRHNGRRSIRPHSSPRCANTTPSASTRDLPARRGPASARPAPGRVDAGAHTSRRRLAPRADAHRARAPDVVDDAEPARGVSPAVRAPRGSGPPAVCDALAASATRSRTLGAAMLAASAGLGVSYLGADLPAREIVDSLEPAGAQVLVLGLTTAAADKARNES